MNRQIRIAQFAGGISSDVTGESKHLAQVAIVVVNNVVVPVVYAAIVQND